jgi:murein DD-endopeptidase MepM/ murein hydrolase activator NlpD
MRHLLALAVVATVVLAPRSFGPPLESPLAEAETLPPLQVVRGLIPARTPLAGALAGTLSAKAIHALVEAARPVHDLGNVMKGHPFGLALNPDGVLEAFTYGIDELRTLRVTRRKAGLEPELIERHYDVALVKVEGRIDSSLFEAVTDLGEQDQLALDLADIFAWDIDFNTEIQSGDSFRLTVEKLSLDGKPRRYGRIRAAEFLRGDVVHTAVWYSGESGEGYYTPDGIPLRKQFLRSPLKFGRITSRFSYHRFHPILKIVRPHLGVDYGAPIGTPVMAVANGVVTIAGWRGGYGRSVQIRHPNGFETLYGHLSSIRVHRGERVTQGMCIGTVGASGLATGPHLDYRMRRAGRFVNPLTVQLPPAPAVPSSERAAFDAVATAALDRLGGRPVQRAAASTP